MNRLTALIVLGLALLGIASSGAETTRFVPLDIYLDSPEPVAAWQFELKDRNAATKVVGVEGGDSDAFQRAPFYDREAVRRDEADRIIVADYSLAEVNRLPTGKIRVATVHLMLEAEADFELTLIAAATTDGRPIDDASITARTTQTRER